MTYKRLIELKTVYLRFIELTLPVLVSKDIILAGDKFYTDSEVYTCKEKRLNKAGKLPLIISEKGVEYGESRCMKVEATTEQIGWKFSKAYLNHDHAYDYKDSSVEMFHPNMIQDIEKNGFKVDIEVKVICPNYGGKHIGQDCSCKSGFIRVPKLFNNKVVMHIKKVRKQKK